jgi:DNA-binding transcriptional MerR regulator
MSNPAETNPRDGSGRFIYTMDAAERDAEACRMRSKGTTFADIADALGYSDESHAYRGVQRTIKRIIQEPAEELRAMELERLDRMYEVVHKVLERQHLTISHGKIIYHGETPVEDTGPILSSIDRLLKIQERRAKLLGLDAATKTQVSGGVKYEVVGVDMSKLR